jgi:hypothetical protein
MHDMKSNFLGSGLAIARQATSPRFAEPFTMYRTLRWKQKIIHNSKRYALETDRKTRVIFPLLKNNGTSMLYIAARVFTGDVSDVLASNLLLTFGDR